MEQRLRDAAGPRRRCRQIVADAVVGLTRGTSLFAYARTSQHGGVLQTRGSVGGGKKFSQWREVRNFSLHPCLFFVANLKLSCARVRRAWRTEPRPPPTPASVALLLNCLRRRYF